LEIVPSCVLAKYRGTAEAADFFALLFYRYVKYLSCEKPANDDKTAKLPNKKCFMEID